MSSRTEAFWSTWGCPRQRLKPIPGSDIKVETNKGVVSLSSDVAITDAQKTQAMAIARNIKGVHAVRGEGLKSE